MPTKRIRPLAPPTTRNRPALRRFPRRRAFGGREGYELTQWYVAEFCRLYHLIQ